MNNIVKIIKIVRPYHLYLFLVAGVILLTTLLELASPYILKLIVDQIELQITTGDGTITQLYFLIGLMFILGVLAILFEAITGRLGGYISGRIGKFLTEKFYFKVFTLPQTYFDSQISGKIVNQLNRGILSLQDFFSTSIGFIVPAFVRTIFIIVVLALYNPVIAALSILVFPFYLYVSHISTKKWEKYQIEKNKIDDNSRGRIQEVISNIRLVKSYNTQYREWDMLSIKLGQIATIHDKQSWVYHGFNFMRNFGLEVGLGIVALILFQATFVGTMSLGEMVLVLQYLNQLRRPLFAMSFMMEQVKRAETGSREYFEILELPSTETVLKTDERPQFSHPTIRFDHVTFEYPESGAVLRDVTMTLDKTETIALVGHSGAGKSTLINLILKLYDPTKGEIFINDHSYGALTHAQIRAHIALVFQENELFSTTIKENVAYGRPDATDEVIIKALKQANAYDFVQKFPNGIHAEIGERGVKLSGGQKQRIQIARAILSDAPILILDEATSSLDAKSEKLVQDALEHLMKDRLVIIIAHRFSTIQSADRVVVIDHGKIVDMGNPAELAKRPGIYSELLRYQIEGNQKLLGKYGLA